MPSYDQLADPPKKGKIIKSAYDSESFEADGTIHVEGVVGSATISPSGRDIALASPDGLAIIDLDSPYNPPRRLRSHGLPWLVVDVQWSPFAARDYWVVSTANHRALVWNLNMREDGTSGAIEHSLQGHSRAITDINFSAHHPDLLTTCSVDGYVHCWDLRRPRQPVVTFCDWFAGATQVKYNRQDPHVLASSHDRWLHIWDERWARDPIKSISAHTSKIYGLDWNRTRSTGLVTCSLDKSIKFWDYENDADQPEKVIRTDYPVWRARHTPFGWGLLAMPQNEPGNLYLYDRMWEDTDPVDVRMNPVAVFPGHGDHKAKEFLWRSRGGISDDGMDKREFQLVSWGTDNELRLHCIDANILSSVGHVKDAPARKNLNLTRQGAAYKTFRTMDDTSNRDRQAGTMSDPRPGNPGKNSTQSALTLYMGPAASQNRQASMPWKGPSMKARVAGNTVVDRSQTQIGWMKGITMTKRKSSAEGQKRQASKDSGILSHDYMDEDWWEPDTIQDEVLRVSQQIPKVQFENIDMDNLALNASLKGPWGVGGETIFIQVKIDIPTQYPKLKAPKFLVEKTSFMPEEFHKKINREVNLLAEQFLQRKQNCLEVAFTYLLGEVDLETSTTLFKNVRDLGDELGDESSSEDDEDIPAGGSASMSQELVPHSDIGMTIATPNRAVMPPPPRTCGARFSHNGRLVCFFPSKEEKARALFSTSIELSKERPKGEPLFAGFGRLTHDLPSRQKYTNDDGSGTDDQSDSDESDDSSSSSSSSESTSIHKMSLWYHPSRQLRKTWSEDRSIRSSGGGTGTGIGTGTGTGTSRRRLGKPRNLISIHNMQADLPSKKEFAQEYAIFGDGAEVCEHNARVAERYGCIDLMHVWRYLALLLRTGVPLEVLSGNHSGDSILVIARDSALKQGRDDGMTASNNADYGPSNISGRVKWGQHPVAVDFIRDLFEYYEKLADIQMLAMLSCIFSETTAEDGLAYVESQLPEPETPLPMKAPSFSLDYFPTDATAWNLYNNGRSHTNSAVTTPGTLHTPVHFAGSPASDDAAWYGDPDSNSYSCGETPPANNRGTLGDADGQSTMSKSPTSKIVQRVNSGLASAFTANLPRSFTRTHSSSPPNQGRKRPSPAEAIMNTFGGGGNSLAWGSTAALNDSSGGRTSLSDDEYRRDDPLPLVPFDVNVLVENQTLFDDDGWLTTPLLEPSRASVMANYRYAYAEMLQMWDQPLARLEVMKFNVLEENLPTRAMDSSYGDSFSIPEGGSSGTAHPRTGSSPIVMGKKDQLQALMQSGRGLDVTGVCLIHEIQLEPARYTKSNTSIGGAVGTCERCHVMQDQLRCVYCLEPVDALYPPCLSCGCASHEKCLEEWHEAGETMCPAGDECNCVEEAANGQVESWAALQGAMLKAQKQISIPPPNKEASDEEDEHAGWERVTGHVFSRPAVNGGISSPSSLTFGRFRKSAGTWSRASSLRRSERRGN
ncbi:hypothetical protein HJFPF1_04840 [Paramyrothecium foliicola]|nr:hypothetical protein HJFPF1_04840 [Paramyrothecium foliicola]